jgi:DNA-binding MarR family transcriptional regulator
MRETKDRPMSNETTLSGGSGQLDMAPVETAVTVLRNACERAIDELGGAVPGDQLRALLVFDDAGGSLDLSRLAAELTASVSATSRMCDRMQEAGLLTVEDATSRRAGPGGMLTGSGRRLARWTRDRQRAALSDVVNSMRPQARDALVYGLGELAAAAQMPT